MVAQPQTQIKPDPPVRLLAGFYASFPDMEPQIVMVAPGREVWLAAIATPGRHYRIFNADTDRRTVFTWRSAARTRTNLRRPLPRWARYPAGVIHYLCSKSPELDIKGVNLALAADEAAGPRREYGMGVAVAALWHDLAGIPYTADSLNKIVDTVRRTYIE